MTYYGKRAGRRVVDFEIPEIATLQAAILPAASQAQQEAGASALVSVTPAVQHYHPSAAKFWAYATVSGGVPSLQVSYNVTSITDAGLGTLDVTIATDFSSANWCAQVTVGLVGAGNGSGVSSQGVGTITAIFVNAGVGFVDPTLWSIAGFGDQ
jgi:hypothetical protein